MSALVSLAAWLQMLAVVAVEVGLIGVAVAALRRWSPTAAWGRTFCHAGIIAALAVTACELSGSARVFSRWAARELSWRDEAPAASDAGQAAARNGVRPRPEDAKGAGTLMLAAEPKSGERAAAPLSASVLAAGELTPAGSRPEAVGNSSSGAWLCLVWLLGAAVVGGRSLLARGLFVIFRLRCRRAADPLLAARVRALGRQLGIRRRVRVIDSGRLTSPIAFGFVCPTVGLPSDFATRFNAAKQDSMLAHELAHLAAHDTCWCLLADATVAMLWWHPGAWWLRRQLHLASEMAADEASLLVADGPRVLAECLVELGTRLAAPALLGQLRVSGFRSHLGRRVQQLVLLEGRAWSPPPRLGAAVTRILGPVAMTATVVLCTAWAAPQALTKGDSMKMMQLSWKHSLATVALLAAFNGPHAPVAAAQPENPVPAPAASPAVPPDPFAPQPQPQPAQVLAAPTAPPGAGENAEQAAQALRARYGPGLVVSPSAPQEKPVRGVKVEAKLKQLVLDEVKFDGLPLGEVLLYLNDQSRKLDPDKNGINFLINPNARPVAMIGGMDPKTGLPWAAATQPFDVNSVIVKFNQPLRAVTMSDLLDAIVMVADHPVEYTLEDYGVVFAAKPEMLEGQPVALASAEMASQPGQPPQGQSTFVSKLVRLERAPAKPVEPPRKPHKPSAELLKVKPQAFNVDFGGGNPSQQVGPAAVGKEGDFWNAVTIGFNDRHTESELSFANHEPSPIEVELINLGGSWSFQGEMGVKSPMMDHYDYPTGNKGGNSQVILHNVPPGKYYVYVYGHGPHAPYYGDYALSVGGRDYGRKQTSGKVEAGKYTKWAEGIQYVKFSNVKVGADENLEILIRPGGQVTDDSGRTFSDAMICGLQLVPVK